MYIFSLCCTMKVLEAIQLKNAVLAEKEAELAAASLVIANVPAAQVVVEGDEVC